MKRRLPPLNAVVAFEAAARHNSFKQAADELCVTSSAISHQVRALEAWLGTRLFERSTRTIQLTDFGSRYRLQISPLLDCLNQYSNIEVANTTGKNTLTLQTTDSFASRWLIPRLSGFESLHSDITIKIVTYDFREVLRASEADLGVLFMHSKTRNATTRGHTLQLLLAEEIFPVCSPTIVRNIKNISVTDLSAFTLIHDDNVGVTWQDWLTEACAHSGDPLNRNTRPGPHYNHAHLALQTAELGGGFTLASNILTSDALSQGRLIAPLAPKITTGCGYYLTHIGTLPAHCQSFSNWLLAQTA